MILYIAHYNEIFLKGRNRVAFENMLIANIKSWLADENTKIWKLEKRIIIESEADEKYVKEVLSRLFGIEWFARIYEVKKDREEIKKFVLEHLSKMKLNGKTIKVETKRGDKNLPYTSIELSREIGAAIVEKLKCGVDLHKPDITIYIDIMQKERAFVHFEKIKGAGGLPTGVSGKVVLLLSGGIDSPVAGWMIMKRGAKATFLHIHPFAKEDELEKSKIMELAKELARWQGGGRIYLADYSEFYKKTLFIPPKYELVLFRRFIYLLAQEIAKKEGALAIVSGDSLGQVASQTLKNIYVVTKGFEMPILRPLVGMDKEEIIKIAQRIGTYNISIKPYKDCCSLVAVQNPETKANANFVAKIEENMGMKEILNKTIGNIKVVDIT